MCCDKGETYLDLNIYTDIMMIGEYCRKVLSRVTISGLRWMRRMDGWMDGLGYSGGIVGVRECS